MFKTGMLIEVTKSHMVISDNIQLVGLELGELLIVVRSDVNGQGLALRIDTGHLVWITALNMPFESPIYVSPLR